MTNKPLCLNGSNQPQQTQLQVADVVGALINPMTTLGDTICGAASGAPECVAGSISASQAVLTQTGTGSASAAPAWVLASALAVGGLLSGVLGSVPYQSAPGTTGFVAPNTSSNKQFFTQTGTGSAGAAPAWAGIASGDLTTALTTPPAIGGATPAAGAFTTLSASGAVTMTANTTSSSTTTGTLVVTGGVGISGATYHGGPISLAASQGIIITAGAPSTTTQTLYAVGTALYWNGSAVGAGSGTVTSVSVTTANGVSGTVATATTTPAITITLGNITPGTVQPTGAITLAASTGLIITAGAPSPTTATLYNVGGALYWAGVALGTVNLASPGPIGGTTASTGSFTTLSGNSITGLNVTAGNGASSAQQYLSVYGSAGANDPPLAYNTNSGSIGWNRFSTLEMCFIQNSGSATTAFLFAQRTATSTYTTLMTISPTGVVAIAAGLTATTIGGTTITASVGFSGTLTGAHNGTVGATTPASGAFTSVTSSGAIAVTGSPTGVAGSIYSSSVDGIILAPKTGSSYDFVLTNAALNVNVIQMPTGTNVLQIPQNIASTSTTTGALVISYGLGVGGTVFGSVFKSPNYFQCTAAITGAPTMSISQHSVNGFLISPVTGSSFDFVLENGALNANVMTIPTGKNYPNFPQSGTYTGTWGTGSDLGLKTDVQAIEGALAAVMSIDTITFRWNELSDNKDKTTRFHGVSAQSVQKVAPDFIMDDRGFLCVDYGKLATFALAAIKEQQAQIEELKRLIA